jgi:hypothetical protein
VASIASNTKAAPFHGLSSLGWGFLVLGALLITALVAGLFSVGLGVVLGGDIRRVFLLPMNLNDGRYAIPEAVAIALNLVLLCGLFGSLSIVVSALRAYSVIGAGKPGLVFAICVALLFVLLEQAFLNTFDKKGRPQKSICVEGDGRLRLVPLLHIGEIDQSACRDNRRLTSELLDMYEFQQAGRRSFPISEDDNPHQREYFRNGKAIVYVTNEGQALRLSDGPGWDRATNSLRRPITPAEVGAIRTRWDERKANIARETAERLARQEIEQKVEEEKRQQAEMEKRESEQRQLALQELQTREAQALANAKEEERQILEQQVRLARLQLRPAPPVYYAQRPSPPIVLRRGR